MAEPKVRLLTPALNKSIEKIDYESIEPAIETGKTAENWRSNFVINVVRVLMIGHIERVDAKPKLAIRRSAQEGHAQCKFTIDPHVQRKVSGIPQAVWHTQIVLKHVDFGKWQSAVHIDDWTKG